MIEAKVEEINEFKGINALKFGAKFGKLTMVREFRTEMEFQLSAILISL